MWLKGKETPEGYTLAMYKYCFLKQHQDVNDYIVSI